MNIVNLIAGAATPMIAGKVAGMFGVPEAAVRKVVAAGVPVLLAAFMKRSAAPGGTDAIAAALGGLGGRNPLDALAGGDAAEATSAAGAGSDLLASILGGGAAGTLASKLGSYAGVDAKAAGPLLGLAGSMTLGGLKKTADEQGLDAAGIMRMLDGQKADIAAAIPADLAKSLAGTDLVGSQFLQAAAPAAAAPRPTVTKAPPPPPAPKSGLMRWLLPLVAVLAVIWIATQFFGRAPEAPVVEAPAPAAPAETAAPVEPAAPATETAHAPAPTAARAAPAATETAAANPLVVDGVDIGASVTGVLDQITGALSGVTDVTSAQAAVTRLTEADSALAGLQGQVGSLSAEGKSSLAALVSAALPAITAAADRLLADGTIGPVIKPAVDGVIAKLTAFAA